MWLVRILGPSLTAAASVLIAVSLQIVPLEKPGVEITLLGDIPVVVKASFPCLGKAGWVLMIVGFAVQVVVACIESVRERRRGA